MSQEHWLKGVDSVAIWPPLLWHHRVVKYPRPREVFSPVLRPDAAVVLDEAEDDGVEPEVREELLGPRVRRLENLSVDASDRDGDDRDEDAEISGAVGRLQEPGLVGQLLSLQPDVDVHLQHLGDEVVEDGVISSGGNISGDVTQRVDHLA